MFRQTATYNNITNLKEYTESVIAYIRKWMDNVTVTRPVSIQANQKSWLKGDV